jgi:hypothetical protein
MRPVSLSLLVLSLFAVLAAACAPLPVPGAAPAAEGLRPIPVDAVSVEVGVGSPIPVDLFVSGSWPDLCAQLAEIRQTVAGSRIEVTLLATPADPACPPDHLGLPFRIAVPLNAVELPTGAYTVVVNGVSAEVEIDPVKALEALPVVEGAQVDRVEVEVGVGSPIPVSVLVEGNFPAACAQLGAIQQTLEGNTFFVTVTTVSPPGAQCAADSLPFRTTLPLNVVGLAPGQYTVNVNGASATFDWGAAR